MPTTKTSDGATNVNAVLARKLPNIPAKELSRTQPKLIVGWCSGK